MTYTKTTWVDRGVTPRMSAAQLNRMETGIAEAYSGAAVPFVVPTLPANPVDGQECYYLADASNGIVWHLKYRALDTSGYPWLYVGGPDLMAAEIQGQESTASTTFTDLATVGPSITVPLSGDYDIEFGAHLDTNVNGGQVYMSFAVGGVAATVNDSFYAYNYNAAGTVIQTEHAGSKVVRKTGIPNGTAIVAKYKALTGTLYIQKRWMRLRPVRVG